MFCYRRRKSGRLCILRIPALQAGRGLGTDRERTDVRCPGDRLLQLPGGQRDGRVPGAAVRPAAAAEHAAATNARYLLRTFRMLMY